MNTHILMDHLTLFYTTNIIQRINPRHEYHNYHLCFLPSTSLIKRLTNGF
jgi:hypothetical protein